MNEGINQHKIRDEVTTRMQYRQKALFANETATEKQGVTS